MNILPCKITAYTYMVTIVSHNTYYIYLYIGKIFAQSTTGTDPQSPNIKIPIFLMHNGLISIYIYKNTNIIC